MKFVQTVKLAMVAGVVTVALMTQPFVAQAEEIISDGSDGVVAITYGVSVLAWARVDGQPSSAASDPEYKYVNVRRTADATADDDDHDVLYDPDDDLLPPPKPVGDAEDTAGELATETTTDASDPAEGFFVRVDRDTTTQN